MSRFARILALLLVAAAIVLAALAFSLSRHKPPTAAPPVATNPVPPPAVTATNAASASRKAAPGDGLPLGIALQLQPGERALAIPIDEVAGVGNRIVPGDFVDVFFELKKTQDRDSETQARLLLSRTHVLAYGNRVIGATPAATSSEGASQRTESASARTAVLAVPVDSVDRLLLATREGKLSLALRHPDDRGVADEALFAEPSSVLLPRRDLTPDQRASVAHPENQAYAGIDVAALAGRDSATSEPSPRLAHTPRGTRADGGVEIIRGTQRGRLPTAACAGGKECAP